MKLARVTSLDATETLPGYLVSSTGTVTINAPAGYVPVSGNLVSTSVPFVSGGAQLLTVSVDPSSVTFVVSASTHDPSDYTVRATFVEGSYIS
jgi:hypothetical protein